MGRAAIGSALVQGLWVLALLAALYGWALSHLPGPQARTVAVVGLVLCNLALLLSNRQRAGIGGVLRVANPVFWAIAGRTRPTVANAARPAIAVRRMKLLLTILSPICPDRRALQAQHDAAVTAPEHSP